MFKYLAAVLMGLSLPAFAGSDWSLAYAPAPLAYELEVAASQCWNLGDLGVSHKNSNTQQLPHLSVLEAKVFKSSEIYGFPKCTFGTHYVVINALHPVTKQALHQLVFSNRVDYRYFPYPTYKKNVVWKNFAASPQQFSEDGFLECDTYQTNGNLQLSITTDAVGNVQITGAHCSAP